MLKNRYNTNISKLIVIQQTIANGHIIRNIFYQESYGKERFQDNLSEPMEVDPAQDAVPTLKRRLNYPGEKIQTVESYVERTRPPTLTACAKLLLVLLGVCVLSVLYLFVYGDKYVVVNRLAQFNYLESDLEANLLDQKAAVRTIMDNVNRVNSRHGLSKLLAFIGTTGTGKTFAANILKRHFIPYHVNEIRKEDLNKLDKAVVNSFDSCCCNLVIVDGLRAEDLSNLIKFIRSLPTDDFSIIIVSIFNIHDTDDGLTYKINRDEYQQIRMTIDTQAGIEFELLIFFEPREEVVEEWLRTKLKKKGVASSRHKSIIADLLRDDHLKKNGFKGLERKLSLID
ncbi:hypothetical protein PPYR_14406 [Photinus pyralis]|uniref:AAA+ ATPase domain-containing protein n=2 Tax=Photinus pyralis TaxID=7054 RepID=A0A5N4A563_PHOPY|nr:uncharacterized protein LOC116181247 [Photinus pyralis]KAB0792447.1 hypothetical protein PPYR_14406 [Photinus pyralis]